MISICLLVPYTTGMPLGLTDAQLVFLEQVNKRRVSQNQPCSVAILSILRSFVIFGAHVSDSHDRTGGWVVQREGYQSWPKHWKGSSRSRKGQVVEVNPSEIPLVEIGEVGCPCLSI